MASTSRLDVLRMIFQVHKNRPFQSELSVLDDDRVFVLGDPVYRPIEGPVENDTGRFAAEARIVFAFEIGRLFSSQIRQLRSAIQPRSGRRTTTACTSRVG